MTTSTPGPTPGPTYAPTPGSVPVRRLRRRSQDRVVAGVCGGFADYAGIDVTLVRVILVILAVFGGSGLIVYLLGWLLIPADDAPQSIVENLLGR